jgi:beta-N-acetylhexosaminidase
MTKQQIGAFISGCAGLTLSSAELDFFAKTNPFGLIVFKRNCESPEQLKALTSAFRNAVGRKDAPVLVDQEGGRVQRMGPPSNVWRKFPKARLFGMAYDRGAVSALRAARRVGRLMAADLIDAGITVDCVPVLDVPQSGAHDVIGNRAYATSPEQIISLARAHAAGLVEGGVIPVMKHMPGHGRALVDSHLSLPRVEASLEELESTDFAPFAAYADCPIGMTAHVVYTAIDKSEPATLSRKVIKSIIRGLIGFDGLLLTDDLSMKALSGTYAEKCKKALAAGCDVVLHCSGVLEHMEEVAAAAGPLKGKSLRRAKAAVKSRRKPLPFDQKAALKDLDFVMGLDAAV